MPSEPLFRRVPTSELSEEEARSILGVLESAFGRWPAFDLPVAPIEHLRWKFVGPANTPYEVLTELDGRIVGTQLTFLRRYLLRGQEVVVQEGVDSTLHPDAQGQGAYRKRRDWSEAYTNETADLVLSFAVNPIVTANRTRDGSRPLPNAPRVLARVFDTRQAAFEALRRRRLPLRSGARVLASRLRPPARGEAPRDWTTRPVDQFDERAERLFARAADGFDFIQVRDQRLLNWRYCDRRGGQFAVNIAEQGGELLGYVVHRVNERWGYLADLLALPGRLDVVESLLEVALRQLRAAGVAAVTSWMVPGHPYERVLRRRGFADTDGQTGFACRPARLAATRTDFLWEPGARVHLMQGDSDWF